MFARLSVVSAVVFAALAAAQHCNTGPVQCCNSVQKASDPATSLLLGLLDVVVQAVDVTVGLDCSPISIVGVASGNSWYVLRLPLAWCNP